MEAEDDSTFNCNSACSEIDPLVLNTCDDSHCAPDLSSEATLRGRLKLCIDFWRSLESSQFILNVISVKVTKFPSSNFRRLLSRLTMLRRFRTVPSFPKLLMNSSMLTLLKKFFACLTLSTRFLFPRAALANKG